MSEKTIIIIRESLWQSVVGDIVTVSALLVATVTGKLLDISALSWIGGFMFIFFLLGKSFSIDKKVTAKSISEARAMLDAMERGE